MYIAIVCFPGCGIMNFEINLIFRIKPLFYTTKMLREPKNKTAFNLLNKKNISSFLTGFSIANNYLRPESAPLT